LPHYTRILDLGDVAAGKVAGRQSDSQRIIAMNLGLVLDDLATAPLVHRAAVEKGLGTWLGS
jgi:ornithine cyclodeaminase/alanine dehydrogenase-like protein (mu-crystallin family)